MKFKNVKLARLVETLQSLFLERSYRYHRKMEKSLLTNFMNCTYCVGNIIMCDLLRDFFFKYGTQSYFFPFITNSTSRMYAHTGKKHVHIIHYHQKTGGKRFAYLLKQSQFFAVFLLLFQLYVVFFLWEICLSTRFLFLINTIVQHLTFVCFCFA